MARHSAGAVGTTTRARPPQRGCGCGKAGGCVCVCLCACMNLCAVHACVRVCVCVCVRAYVCGCAHVRAWHAFACLCWLILLLHCSPEPALTSCTCAVSRLCSASGPFSACPPHPLGAWSAWAPLLVREGRGRGAGGGECRGTWAQARAPSMLCTRPQGDGCTARRCAPAAACVKAPPPHYWAGWITASRQTTPTCIPASLSQARALCAPRTSAALAERAGSCTRLHSSRAPRSHLLNPAPVC